jgi:hypothetical protein
MPAETNIPENDNPIRARKRGFSVLIFSIFQEESCIKESKIERHTLFTLQYCGREAIIFFFV